MTTEVESFISTKLPNAVHVETYNGNVAMVAVVSYMYCTTIVLTNGCLHCRQDNIQDR